MFFQFHTVSLQSLYRLKVTHWFATVYPFSYPIFFSENCVIVSLTSR